MRARNDVSFLALFCFNQINYKAWSMSALPVKVIHRFDQVEYCVDSSLC